MKKELLVSVIVPVYNVKKYLKRCLDSIVGQTYKNLEIILVDDGSTDGSGEICDKYAEGDGRIRVIHGKNGGVSVARELGLEASRGEYIAFVDSDDIVASEYIEKMIFCANKYGAEIVSCGYKKIKNDVSARSVKKDGKIFQFDGVTALESLLYQKQFDSSLWNKIIKRELFGDVKFHNLDMFEDLDIVCRLFLKSKKIVYMDSGLYYYRLRGESLMNGEFSNKNFVVLDVLERMKKSVMKQCPKLEGACDSRILSALFYIYRNIDRGNEKYDECVKEIKTLRDKVWLDDEISKRTKIAIVLSRIDMKLIKLQNVLGVN